MKISDTPQRRNLSRRDFVKGSTVAGLAALLTNTSRIHAAGSDKIRVGIIGCGRRGTFDAKNCVNSSENVVITAMGDLFADKLENSRNYLTEKLPDKVQVTNENCFVGWDAYKDVLKTDIDLVILTETPHFRPAHLRAAVEAGKHVFMEKPVAVDPVGVRSVIESSKLAQEKNLTILAGTQLRRISHIVEIIKRIHRGDIGEILSGQYVRIGDAMLNWGPDQRDSHWSDMEWQIRNWLFNTWLSGDFIVEMHVHNLDLMNWAMGSTPIQCIAMGGRQVRTDPQYGNVYDHFAVEYEYPNGVRIEYMGAQMDAVTVRLDHRLVGTKGSAYFDFGNAFIEGQKPFKYEDTIPDPHIIQHADQINAIRNGLVLNEGKRIAESTLTSIMGRVSAYTGRALTWNWIMNASKLDLSLPDYEFGPRPTGPVAMPGKTPLI